MNTDHNRRPSFAFAAVAVSAVLAASAPLLGQHAAAPAADPAAAVLAAHKKADEAYAKAPMSPFSAVAVQYFEPGQTVRLNIGAGVAAFGERPTTPDAVDLTLEDGAFFVTPVTATAPTVAKTSGDGDVTGLPGTAVKGKTRLAPREVLCVGRYFVEMFARPDSGNARVFDPQAPARKAFAGLKWYAPNLALQVKARFVANPTPSSVTIATSRGLQKEYFRVGSFEFAIDGAKTRLIALAVMAAPKAGDELFVAFRDATTGTETYSVGRYLFVPFAGVDGGYILDFNAATNPLCNYSPHYNCPIPLKDNVLPMAIRAGEMTFPVKH
jgi:hypothetical protein